MSHLENVRKGLDTIDTTYISAINTKNITNVFARMQLEALLSIAESLNEISTILKEACGTNSFNVTKVP